MWASKMSSIKEENDKKLAEIKEKYDRKMKDAETNGQKKLELTTKELNAALQGEKKKTETLSKMNEQEVKDIFEDKKTLAFIQKMRTFKKTWSDNKEVQKRKSTAASMAETTKNWISQY